MSRKIYIIIAVVLTVVLSVSTFFIIRNHIDSAKQNEVYDNLAEIVEDEPPKENEGVTFSEDKDYLAEYLELYRQNEDMVGWIKVEDTNINYPVVQSVNEPNFYLKHKFDKTYSAYGCPYVQENCDVQKPSDNIIIYGHHMNDGSMFTGLMKYRNKSFWEGHKTITFDTLTDRHQYEVIAIMFDDPFERAEEERLEQEREELRQCEIRKARIALSMLQPLQRERLMKNVCCGLSSRAIAKQEGVYYSSVDKSIAAAKKNFIKFYENL